MSAFTCGFCGRVSANDNGWKEIFIKPLDRPDGDSRMMLCPSCYSKFISPNINAVKNDEDDINDIIESFKDRDPVRTCVGMTLRDFLSSDMYLVTQNIFFRDDTGADIPDCYDLLDNTVLSITKPDEKGRRYAVISRGRDIPENT